MSDKLHCLAILRACYFTIEHTVLKTSQRHSFTFDDLMYFTRILFQHILTLPLGSPGIIITISYCKYLTVWYYLKQFLGLVTVKILNLIEFLKFNLQNSFTMLAKNPDLNVKWSHVVFFYSFLLVSFLVHKSIYKLSTSHSKVQTKLTELIPPLLIAFYLIWIDLQH